MQKELQASKKKRAEETIPIDTTFTTVELQSFYQQISNIDAERHEGEDCRNSKKESQSSSFQLLDRTAMEAFVQKTFTKDWNWHSEKRHQKYLRWLLQKSASVLDHSERRYYKQLYEIFNSNEVTKS
jgi:hypothetical protein